MICHHLSPLAEKKSSQLYKHDVCYNTKCTFYVRGGFNSAGAFWRWGENEKNCSEVWTDDIPMHLIKSLSVSALSKIIATG